MRGQISPEGVETSIDEGVRDSLLGPERQGLDQIGGGAPGI